MRLDAGGNQANKTSGALGLRAAGLTRPCCPALHQQNHLNGRHCHGSKGVLWCAELQYGGVPQATERRTSYSCRVLLKPPRHTSSSTPVDLQVGRGGTAVHQTVRCDSVAKLQSAGKAHHRHYSKACMAALSEPATHTS